MHMAHHWVQHKTYTHTLLQPLTSYLHTIGQKSFRRLHCYTPSLVRTTLQGAGHAAATSCNNLSCTMPPCLQCDSSLVTAHPGIYQSTSNRRQCPVAQRCLADQHMPHATSTLTVHLPTERSRPHAHRQLVNDLFNITHGQLIPSCRCCNDNHNSRQLRAHSIKLPDQIHNKLSKWPPRSNSRQTHNTVLDVSKACTTR